MASRKNEIESLRQLARKRHRAATAKASRLRAKGVEITGTDLDPRRNVADISRMRSRDLERYIGKLNQFTSRDVTYVAGAKAPLRGDLWRKYETLQNAVNRMNAKPYEKIKNFFIPSMGMTIEQSMGMKPTHPVTGNPASRAPHLPIQKSPKGITSNKQLLKNIKDLEARLSADYSKKVYSRDHKIASTMIRTINDKAVSKMFKSLSPQEFNTLWNYMDFANAASFDYEIAKTQMQDPKAVAAFNESFDVQKRHMIKQMKDVKALDLVRQSANLKP